MDLPPITPRARPASLDPRAPKPDAEAQREAAARETAQAFEAAFLAEMLRQSGVNRTPEALGGGAGEDAFASFLTQEYGTLLSARGGVGVAEQIFNAIYRKGGDT